MTILANLLPASTADDIALMRAAVADMPDSLKSELRHGASLVGLGLGYEPPQAYDFAALAVAEGMGLDDDTTETLRTAAAFLMIADVAEFTEGHLSSLN